MRDKPYIEEEEIQDQIFLDALHHEEQNAVQFHLYEKYGKRLKHYRRFNNKRGRKLTKFTKINKLLF